MNKTELIGAAAVKSGMSMKDAAKVTNALLDVISERVHAGESVSLLGFGTFAVKERAARTGHNPATGGKIEIAAKKVVRFTSGSALKL